MDNTVAHKELHRWWDGLVIIDEIKEYADDRGSLVELWRNDDGKMTQHGGESGLMGYVTHPQMSYWSVTKPFVIRGPHQHIDQTDWFITWKSTMVYQLLNPKTKEMKYFITDPTKVTRVKVAPPIIHSYRNIDCKDSLTGNFPTSLFMGEDKKGYKPDMKLDEVRHEEIIQPTKNIWVLGVNGRLGKAMVKKLYDDMGYHKYNVIPITEKFTNDREGLEKLHAILKTALYGRLSEHDVIVNCMGKTNVQDPKDDFVFANYLLPKFLAEFCISHRLYFVHFSTDYVYQQGELSPYTKSKVAFEQWLDDSDEEPRLKGIPREDVCKYARIVRVANLFSQDKADEHNAIFKLYWAALKGQLNISKGHIIMPTDVADIAAFMSAEYLHNIDNFDAALNLSGKPYTTEQIIKDFAGLGECWTYIENGTAKVINKPSIFLESKNYKQLDCDAGIKNKILTIKGLA